MERWIHPEFHVGCNSLPVCSVSVTIWISNYITGHMDVAAYLNPSDNTSLIEIAYGNVNNRNNWLQKYNLQYNHYYIINKVIKIRQVSNFDTSTIAYGLNILAWNMHLSKYYLDMLCKLSKDILEIPHIVPYTNIEIYNIIYNDETRNI